VLTILVLLKFKKVQEPIIIIIAALIGLALKSWL
jgi:chromate transporter